MLRVNPATDQPPPVHLHVLVHVPLPARVMNLEGSPCSINNLVGNGNVYVQVHVQGDILEPARIGDGASPLYFPPLSRYTDGRK